FRTESRFPLTLPFGRSLALRDLLVEFEKVPRRDVPRNVAADALQLEDGFYIPVQRHDSEVADLGLHQLAKNLRPLRGVDRRDRPVEQDIDLRIAVAGPVLSHPTRGRGPDGGAVQTFAAVEL